MKINHTKERVLSVLRELLSKKLFRDISTKELCEQADISRTTFYRLFEDKYDLLRCFYSSIIDSFQTEDKSYESTANEIRRYMTSHRSLMKNLLRSDEERYFEKYLFDLTYKYHLDWVLRQSGLKELPPELLMDIEMYSAMDNYALIKWIMLPREEPPEILYKWQTRAMPESIRRYLLDSQLQE